MKKKLLIGAGAFLLICIAVFVLSPNPQEKRLRAPERKQWKETSLTEIAERAKDFRGVSNELARLRSEMATDVETGWIGTNLLVMTNGEWLLYQNKCAKEPGHIHDLFLAQGSDGKWYFSTFHFCISMITLHGRMYGEEDHGSIAEFVRTYAVRPFDGKSDDCLEKTWPVKQ
jgi:hypothetical protein